MSDLNRISGTIVDRAFPIRSALGPGLLESVDEAVLARALENRGLRINCGAPVIKDGIRL
jgi:hypothetical protein